MSYIKIAFVITPNGESYKTNYSALIGNIDGEYVSNLFDNNFNLIPDSKFYDVKFDNLIRSLITFLESTHGKVNDVITLPNDEILIAQIYKLKGLL